MTRLTDSEVERALSQAPNLDLARESVRRVARNLDDLVAAGLELDTTLDLAAALIGTLDSAGGGTRDRDAAGDVPGISPTPATWPATTPAISPATSQSS